MTDLLIIAGAIITVLGLWAVYPPLGAIGCGGLLMAAGLYARFHNTRGGQK